MNNAEAKFILQSYRADGADARDPAFREALDQAGVDPALGQWLREEMETDRVLAEKLSQVAPPAHLMGELLAARRMASRDFGRGRRTRRLALAACALAVAGLALYLRWISPPLVYASYVDMAVRFLDRPFSLDLMTHDPEDVQEWLLKAGAPAGTRLPSALAASADAGIGCRALSWRGQRVALLCFGLEHGRPVHLFTMESDALQGAVPDGAPQLAQRGKWATAIWAQGGQVFVLAAEGDLDALRTVLPDEASG